MAEILSVCVSEKTGTVKSPVEAAMLVANHGIEGDAHAGTERQVSLLSIESIRKMREKGLDIRHGMFAENLVLDGLRIEQVSVGQVYDLSSGAVLEVMRIGKPCHSRCEIFRLVGDCVMPREGFFARVLNGGEVKPGDRLCLREGPSVP